MHICFDVFPVSICFQAVLFPCNRCQCEVPTSAALKASLLRYSPPAVSSVAAS